MMVRKICLVKTEAAGKTQEEHQMHPQKQTMVFKVTAVWLAAFAYHL
jgi:hypothetical protein